MKARLSDPRLDVPLRNATAKLPEVQFSNTDAGEVLDCARGIVRIEPKQMADTMGISHSLVLRGLKTGELNFQRLWELDNDYWAELIFAAAKKRRIGTVRRTLDLERSA